MAHAIYMQYLVSEEFLLVGGTSHPVWMAMICSISLPSLSPLAEGMAFLHS